MIKNKELKKLQFVVQIFMFLVITSPKMFLFLWINLRVKLRIGETILKMLFIRKCPIQSSQKIKEFRLKQLLKIQIRTVIEKSKIKIVLNLRMLKGKEQFQERKIINLIKQIIVYNLNHLYKIVHTYHNCRLQAESIQ